MDQLEWLLCEIFFKSVIKTQFTVITVVEARSQSTGVNCYLNVMSVA